jgi:dynein heavy chain
LRKYHYVPELNKKAIIFIDDLNMPLPEKYGAQPPIELFRNLIDHNFLYEKYVNSKMIDVCYSLF